jgi:type IV pilus assembly protein PilQ
MRRLTTLWLAMIWLMGGMPHALAGHPRAIPGYATLRSITLPDPSVGREVQLRIDGEYQFETSHASQGVIYVDLLSTEVGDVTPSTQWATGAISGYRLMEFKGSRGEPGVRVELQTREPQSVIVVQESAGLRLLLAETISAPGAPPAPAAPATPAPETPAPVAPPARSSIGFSTPATRAANRAAAPAAETRPSAARAEEGPGLVSDIVVRPGSAGEVSIDVATSTSAPFRVLRLDSPDRLVVDIEGMENAVSRRIIDVSSPLVKDIRVRQFRKEEPKVVRVVADLSGRPECDVHGFEGGLHLEVRPRGAPPSSPEVAPGSSTERPAPAPRSRQAAKEVARAPYAHGERMEISGGERTSTSVAAQSLPTPRGRNNNAAAAPPQQAGEASQNPRPANLQRSYIPIPATPEGSGTPPAAQAAGLQPARGEKPAFSGELISLDLKDVDVKDFLRLIHELSGLNIVVDPAVSGSVTLVLDSVPWDQALDIVLRNNGLGKVLEGNVLRIAKTETLKAEQEEVDKSAPLVTVFRPMNYAKAKEISPLIKTIIGGGLSPRGSTHVDDRTNTLIITDLASQIPVVQQLLDRLDTKTKQVAIEARIVLANSTFQRTLGVALLGAGRNPSGSTSATGQTGTGSSLTPVASTTSSTSSSTAILPPWTTFTAPANPTTGFGVVAITNFSERYLIDAAISAAEIRSQAKTISRPSLITQENTQGMVQQGTQIPVQTSINNTVSVQYVDATLQLTVTPQVTNDAHIFLNIKVQNASPGTIVTDAAVSINIQSATTQVLVPDGGTVVFGGVTVTERQKSSTGIPLLGNIPILGNLFKTTNVQDSDQELLFFVSPKLLTT